MLRDNSDGSDFAALRYDDLLGRGGEPVRAGESRAVCNRDRLFLRARSEDLVGELLEAGDFAAWRVHVENNREHIRIAESLTELLRQSLDRRTTEDLLSQRFSVR